MAGFDSTADSLDDAIDRVNRWRDSGADIAFIEASESRAELEKIARRVKHPLFVNMLSGGVTPILSVKESWSNSATTRKLPSG